MAANDWKLIGLFVSKLQDLYVVVRDTFAEMNMGINIEIIPWLIGDGKKSFIEKLKALGTEFDAQRRIRLTDDPNIIFVNLDAPPKLPYKDTEVRENTRGGWVKLEKRMFGLYVNGKKIILHLDLGQKDRREIGGYKLKEALTEKLVEHPNILDALLEYPHLIPDEFKPGENSHIKCIVFWAVVFHDQKDDYLCVRCLFWIVSKWDHSNCLLDGNFDDNYPAALHES